MKPQSKDQYNMYGVNKSSFYGQQYLKQLLKKTKKEVEKPQNQMTKEECKMAFPKSKWFQPQESPTQRAEIPENLLQDYANEAIELKNWSYIRFHTALLGWIKNNPAVPQWVRKCFFSQVAGKLPDNLIMAQVAPGMFLACKMELKTQDTKGRAVGKTHGKQKLYAEAEEWYIARSPEQINLVLVNIEKAILAIKPVIIKTVLSPEQTQARTVFGATLTPGYRYVKPTTFGVDKKQSIDEKDIVSIINQLVDARVALQANYPDVALDNINEIIARHEK